MKLITQTFLGGVGVTGVAGAAGIPIALNSLKTSQNKKIASNVDHEQISITHCDSTEGNTFKSVNFGDKNSKNVCWTIESEKQENWSSSEFNKLFSKEWKKGIEKEMTAVHDGPNWWTRQCNNSGAPWIISDPEEKSNYFGLCSQDGAETTSFAKKMQQGDSNLTSLTIQICNQDCWKYNNERENVKLLQQVKQENWKPVKFFDKNQKTMNSVI